MIRIINGKKEKNIKGILSKNTPAKVKIIIAKMHPTAGLLRVIFYLG